MKTIFYFNDKRKVRQLTATRLDNIDWGRFTERHLILSVFDQIKRRFLTYEEVEPYLIGMEKRIYSASELHNGVLLLQGLEDSDFNKEQTRQVAPEPHPFERLAVMFDKFEIYYEGGTYKARISIREHIAKMLEEDPTFRAQTAMSVYINEINQDDVTNDTIITVEGIATTTTDISYPLDNIGATTFNTHFLIVQLTHHHLDDTWVGVPSEVNPTGELISGWYIIPKNDLVVAGKTYDLLNNARRFYFNPALKPNIITDFVDNWGFFGDGDTILSIEDMPQA